MRHAGAVTNITFMSPDDVALVDRSWRDLHEHRFALRERLTELLAQHRAPAAGERASWLLDAVDELVDLLPAPSRLAPRARQFVAACPCPGEPPTFDVDGRAWMTAARDVCPTCTTPAERAWGQAWMLLSSVLAETAPSPFGAPDDARHATTPCT
jgi:hypothetical protein